LFSSSVAAFDVAVSAARSSTAADAATAAVAASS
jgi:hypothetical protein